MESAFLRRDFDELTFGENGTFARKDWFQTKLLRIPNAIFLQIETIWTSVSKTITTTNHFSFLNVSLENLRGNHTYNTNDPVSRIKTSKTGT